MKIQGKNPILKHLEWSLSKSIFVGLKSIGEHKINSGKGLGSVCWPLETRGKSPEKLEPFFISLIHLL